MAYAQITEAKARRVEKKLEERERNKVNKRNLRQTQNDSTNES